MGGSVPREVLKHLATICIRENLDGQAFSRMVNAPHTLTAFDVPDLSLLHVSKLRKASASLRSGAAANGGRAGEWAAAVWRARSAGRCAARAGLLWAGDGAPAPALRRGLCSGDCWPGVPCDVSGAAAAEAVRLRPRWAVGGGLAASIGSSRSSSAVAGTLRAACAGSRAAEPAEMPSALSCAAPPPASGLGHDWVE